MMEILFLIGWLIFGGYFVYGGINHFLQLPSMTHFTASKNVPAPPSSF